LKKRTFNNNSVSTGGHRYCAKMTKFYVNANGTECPDFHRKEAPTTSGHHSYRTWHCQDGTDRLWQNIIKQMPKYVA